jgi:hypothetical protein
MVTSKNGLLLVATNFSVSVTSFVTLATPGTEGIESS